MKKGKTNKLGRRILSIVLTVALVVGLMPGNVMTVRAEESSSTELSVTAFATPEQLMSSDNFALHTDTGSGTAQKVYFGMNGESQQTWYIAGSDADNSIVLLCDPMLPMTTGCFDDKNDLVDDYKIYDNEWNCTYGTAPSQVYANHYGASDLRLTTFPNLESSAFSTSEQDMMLATKVYTDDDKLRDEHKSEYTYYTTDKLYAAYGVYEEAIITVGENSADSLNSGLKVSLTSGPYTNDEATKFYLRTPYLKGISNVHNVSPEADNVGFVSVKMTSTSYAVVPAFRLNLASVLFASAAPAATPAASLTDTMIFRVDDTEKIKSKAAYATCGVTVNYDEGDGNVFLYVQDADSVYSVEITRDTIVALSDMTGINNLTDENTKIWLEKSEDNVAYAVMAEALLTEHIPNADDGDCTTAITCSICGTVTTEAKENHIDDNGDGICDHCDSYVEPKQEDEYYQIANANNLMWFAQKVNEGQIDINAKLTADIYMNGIDWTIMSSFAGTFDGNGYTISGLNGHKADTGDTHGFIRTLADGGVVKNLTFTEADIWNHEGPGAISAVIVYTNNGTVENCVVKESVIQHGNYDALGVVVGVNGGTIRNCASISNTMTRRFSSAKDICGFVWSNSGSIENCFNYDCTYQNGSNRYAFTGINNGTITNCYYYESSETISDTVVDAKTADQFAGGEVAYLLQSGQTADTETSEIPHVWGQTLTGENAQVYPVLNGDKVYRYESVKCDSSSKDPAVYGYSNEEKSDVIDEHNVDSNGFCTACGAYEKPEIDENGVYQISNAGELYWFADKVNNDNANYGSANAKLKADIVVNSDENISSYNGTDSVSWRPWTPIGNNSNKYTGTFDGNNKTVSGLYFNNTSQNYVGLFGYLDDGEIKNVGVVNSYFNGNNYVGGVCGRNYGTITNCYNTGTVVGAWYVGGVCSYNSGGTIENCYNTGCVSATFDYVGGVCGYNSGGTIENCYNTGCVSGTYSVVGGVCGINYGTITNCYYDNTVYTGNAVSSNSNGTLTSVEGKSTDQFASGEVTYLLNGSSSENVTWYQKLLTDTYPVLDSKHGKVYYGYVDCQSQDKIYANTELSKDKPEHSWKCEPDEANTNKMTFSCTGCTKGGTITVTAPEGAIYDGNNHTATVTVETEENEELIETPVITYTSLTEGVELVDGKPVNAGTYKASITFGEVTVYDEFEIAKATPDIGTVSAENMKNTLDISKVVLSRTDDTISGTFSLKEGTELAYGTKDYTYVFKFEDANYNDVEGTVSITISDTIAPTATYQIGTNGFKAFMNAITFGFFFKDTQTVEIQYTDDTTDANGNITKGSGIKTKQYYIASSVVANDAVGSISWTDYTKSISLDKNGKYFVYTKVVDNAGNTVILNSDGIVIYEDSVVTTDSADYTYKSNKDITFEMDAKGNTFATLKDSEGNEVDAEYYTVTDNSKVTFKAAYLDILKVASKPYTYKIYMNPQGVETNKTELSCEISINVLAKELTVTGATATGRTYEKGNTSVAITVVALEGVANSDAVSVDVTGLKGTLSGANAGDYTEVTLPELKLSGADKDNYVLTQPSKAVPTNVTISPQATGTAQNVTKKYLFSQENADTINLVSLLPKDCGTVVSYGTPAVDGNVTYKVAPSIEEGSLAYTVADGLAGNTGTIKIDAKTQNYTSVPITISVALVEQIPVTQQTEVTLKDESQKLTYGQKLSVLELTEVVFKGNDGETVNGTLQWKNGDSIPTVDTKKASWEFVPSASYNDKYATVEGELTISVVPATPVVDTLPTVNAITYHPDTTIADIALSGGKMNGIAGELTGTWAWKDATICPKAGDNAYVAVFTPEDGTNYKTKEVDITVSVAKATPYIKSAVAAKAVTYGATLKDSVLSGGTVQYSETDETAVAGSWSWKEVTTKPVVADSNVTEYDVVFTPTDAENYNKVETKITLTVNKAETTPNMPESTMSVLYSQKTVGAVELPEGWVWNEADSAKELTVDVAVEATAIYNGADKGNYVTESVTISITRQACDHEESDILYTGEGEKAPTCTVDGIGHTECTKCKEPMQTNVTVEASGHTGGTATCKNKAECSVCHEGYGELDKNNHAGETEVKDAKEATCAVDGYTGDTYCKDCGAKIATGTKIDKSTAHTWDNGVVTKEATATEKGEKTYTCSVCKTTKKEEVPALGAPKVGEEIASEDGSATYKVTEAGENANSVTYEAPTDKNQATVVVPATVTINNITYNVTTISDTAFAGNMKLTSVTIGDNVTGFSANTFKGCSNLKTVDVGNGVTSIPANAFKNFKNLTTVKIGTGVKTIGKNAFYGCKKLKNLTIGKNVVTIGDKAFYKCTSLTKVTIPSKVKTIGKSTFEGCKALKTITIGKSVTKIGSKAFYGCSKTKTLTIKSSKLTTKKIGSKAFAKTPKNMTVKVPKKKFDAYKTMLMKRGVNKKARFKKN